jgi:DNA-binding IclR family transcriptional regulator
MSVPTVSAKKAPIRAKDRQFVTALSRGLEILRCFDAQRPSLGTVEIARLTGLPQPTVWRLCHTLVEEGYLVQTERKDKLRPGIPILSLGYSAIASTPIAELAIDAMRAIAIRHEGSVALGMRDGSSMIYVQRCQGSQIVFRDLGIGSRVPLLTSSTGWGYLAGLDERRRKAVMAEIKQDQPEQYRQMARKFVAAMQDFSRAGYVVNKGLLHPQINGVSVPVVSDDGAKIMGLSAGGITQLFDDRKLKLVGADLKKLAAELSSVLTTQHSIR